MRESVCVHVCYSLIFVASHCSLLYIVIVCISLFAVRSNDCRPLPSKLWTPGTLGGMCLSINGPICSHTRNR